MKLLRTLQSNRPWTLGIDRSGNPEFAVVTVSYLERRDIDFGIHTGRRRILPARLEDPKGHAPH